MPVSTGARLMGINRSSAYYVKYGVSQDELDCKAEIDKIHTDNSVWGIHQITKQLKHKAFRVATPEILNSDQGSQFTSNEYKQLLKSNGVQQSMDGKSRWADNIMIERWFRTIKYEEIYLTQYTNIKEARKAIRQYINIYNFKRIHSSIGDRVPAEAYYPDLLIEAARKVA